MNQRGYSADADHDEQRPSKRARRTPPVESNGHADQPPLSLSILGVEPLDEFILAVADFVHKCIKERQDRDGVIEVEAKLGILRENGTKARLSLPVEVETSAYTSRVYASSMSPI